MRRRYEQKRKRQRRRGSRFVCVGGGRHARQRGSQRAKRAEEERKESWRRRRRVEVVVFRGFVVARNARLRADVDQRQDTDFTDTGGGDAAIQGEEERGSDEHFRGFDDDGVDRRCTAAGDKKKKEKSKDTPSEEKESLLQKRWFRWLAGAACSIAAVSTGTKLWMRKEENVQVKKEDVATPAAAGAKKKRGN